MKTFRLCMSEWVRGIDGRSSTKSYIEIKAIDVSEAREFTRRLFGDNPYDVDIIEIEDKEEV